MLIAAYDGDHSLDLENLFRKVAWTSLYYGGSSIDDPLLSSLSHFKRICNDLGIQLDYVPYWNKWYRDWILPKHSPYLLIISGSSSLEINQILELVENGSNLLIISPPMLLVENISEGSRSDFHKYFLESLQKQLDVSIKEVREKDFGKGRIFYINGDEINDLFLEPGPFGGCKESDKEAKQENIRSLIKRITTFKVPCISFQVRSVPNYWPQDKSLVIEIELFQRSSCVIEEVIVTVEIPPSFEPLSTTEIQLQNLLPNSKRSLAILVVPRSRGIYHNPLNIRVKYQKEERQMFLPESKIEIIGNLPDLLRASRSTNVDLASTLPKYEEKFQPVATASNIIDLLNVDPDAVVTKVRRIGEHICKSIARQNLNSYNPRWTFADTTRKLFEASIFNPKTKGYIDTIRIFGNMAAHADNENITSFNHEDALSVCYALVLFLKEVTEANLI